MVYMKIGFNVFTNNNNNNSISFGAVEKIKHIKRLPNAPCALCGKKAIMEDAVKKAYASVTLPLSVIVGKGLMDKWKDKPLIWEVITVFAQVFPKESLDQMIVRDEEFLLLKKAAVKEIINIRGGDGTDQASHKAILKLYNSVLQDSRSELKPAEIVLKKFKKFKKLLQGIWKDTFEQLQIYAKKYPSLRLFEILNIPEIKKFHGIRNNFNKIQKKNERDYHFKIIEEIVQKSKPEMLEDINNAKKELMDSFNEIKFMEARKHNAKKIYSKVLEKHNALELKNKIFKELEKLPYSHSSVDGLITNFTYFENTDGQIIDNVISPFISSYEHIIPRSKNGKNALGNGLMFHTICNKKRGNTPYTEFLEYHPELEKNIKKQIMFFTEALLKGEMEDSLKYEPLKVTRTLNEYTNSQIIPDIREYCIKRIQAVSEKIYSKNNLEAQEANTQYKIFTEFLNEFEEIYNQKRGHCEHNDKQL